MPLFARRLLFALFVLAFLFTAAGVLSHSLGFQFSWQAKRFLRTGLISVSTIPSNARIFLDGKLLKTSTPTLLKNLLPVEHRIRFEKDGFFPFEKTTPIAAQRTTFLESVLLFSVADATAYTLFGIQPALSPNATKVASISESGAWKEIWIQSLANSDDRQMLARFSKTEATKIELSFLNEEHLLIRRMDAVGMWREERVGPSIAKEPYKKPVSPFLFKRQGDQTLLVRHDDTGDTPVALLPEDIYTFASAPDPFLLLSSSRGEIFVIDTRSQDAPILLKMNAHLFAWATRAPLLLYSNGIDLHLFNATSLTDDLLLRTSEEITTLSWHPEETVMFFGTKNGFSAVDLHKEGGFVIEPFPSLGGVSGIFFDPSGTRVYLLMPDRSDGLLFVRPLR